MVSFPKNNIWFEPTSLTDSSIVIVMRLVAPGYTGFTHVAAHLDLSDWPLPIGLNTFRRLIALAKEIGRDNDMTITFAAIMRKHQLDTWAAKRNATISF